MNILVYATVAAHGAVVYATPIDFTPVLDPIAEYVDNALLVRGAGLLIERFDGTVLTETYWGDFDRSHVIPIASASKWFGGAAAASLAAAGMVDLDAPVGESLVEFAPYPLKGTMTVRQMFSHTSGIAGNSTNPDFDWTDTSITLAECSAGIAQYFPMSTIPGDNFSYGGVSMQIGGRACEIAAGEPWEALVQSRLLTPLGITDTDYDGLGPTTNPRVAGSMQTSIESYARLLRMIASNGLHEGFVVLAPGALGMMLSDQTNGAAFNSAPPTIEEFFGYGLGCWVLRRDAEDVPVEFASPGAFGAYPWIDFEYGYFGVFFVDDRLGAVDGFVDDLRAFTRAALSCQADLNGDGAVGAADLSGLLASWGSPAADLTGDGATDAADLSVVLAAWGACP